MSSQSVEVSSISVLDLFDYNLKIPEYQRPYVWTKKEIKKLLFQISEHESRVILNKPNFYLGSIVLHKDGDYYNIIDGQQRLTTLQLLNYIHNGIDYNMKYAHPITFKQIQENYNYFKENDFEIEDFASINVTVVVTNDEDMAYNFFETLNTGGKRLGGTDILKAHHLRSIKDIDYRNSFALKWEKKQKNLETVNRILSKIRRIDYLKRYDFIPNKFTDDNLWKNVLTEDFAEKSKKNNRDIGYSFVEIEENTHTVTADKYAIRQPLNEGVNYINYLLNFTEDYNFLFAIDDDRKDKYAIFIKKLLNVIDGTVDLKYFYQLTMICFVDRFGRKNILEFSLYLFRFLYSLRLWEQTRIYEPTVKNFIENTKILERILNAFTYEEIIDYLKNYTVNIKTIDISGVKQRHFERVNRFFEDKISKDDFDKDLLIAIKEYLN